MPSLLGPRPERAFTLIEIALSLAIIGFALVAIIGVLPAGLRVQQENREETIINQDGLYFLEAIRRGAADPAVVMSLNNTDSSYFNDLTNYVDAITIDWRTYNSNGVAQSALQREYYSPNDEPFGILLDNGRNIIGLLSTPKYQIFPNGTYRSNHVNAYVRAISGVAGEKASNVEARDFAFAYRLTSEIVPYGFYGTGTNSPPLPPSTPQQQTIASNAMSNLRSNLHEVRLTIQWPLRPPPDQRFGVDTNVGPYRMSFRTLAGGQLVPRPVGVRNTSKNLYFLQPQTYRKADD